MRTYSLTNGLDHFLIEAENREQAHQIIEEEGIGPNIEWSAHHSLEWKRAWRHGKVKVLKATRLPKGIE